MLAQYTALTSRASSAEDMIYAMFDILIMLTASHPNIYNNIKKCVCIIYVNVYILHYF